MRTITFATLALVAIVALAGCTNTAENNDGPSGKGSSVEGSFEAVDDGSDGGAGTPPANETNTTTG